MRAVMREQDPNRHQARPLWIVAVALLAFVTLWPVAGGMLAVNDDIKFVRVPAHREPLLAQVTEAWRHSPSFRPLELAVAASCDERSLRAWLAFPVQAAGLGVLAWGLVALARRVAPGRPWVAPVALAWTMLSPGTSCAAWQIDAGSQTWSAALGIWACALAWRSVAAAVEGRVDWKAWWLLALVFALGVNVKETFYGWSAGVGLACIGATAWLLIRDRRAGLRASLILWPVVALPVAHLVLRWATGAMAQSMDARSESRYQLELGFNVLMNAAQSVAGAVGTGPFYALADGEAPLPLRALPLMAGVAELVLLLVALEFTVLRPAPERRLQWMPVTLALAAGLVSLAVTFPMGSVSELYGFGANATMGLLLGVVVDGLWNGGEPESRRLTRGLVAVCMGAAVLIGAHGLAGRAHAFWCTWQRTRLANESILTFIEKRPAAPKYFDAPLCTIYFPANCRPDRTYGSYIMPVAQAIDIVNTVDWMQRNDVHHPTTFSVDQDAPNATPYEWVVDCGSMPQYGHW